MSDSGTNDPALPGTNDPAPPLRKLVLTDEECLVNFKAHVDRDGLGVFHTPQAIAGFVPIAKEMIRVLFARGCGKEIALQLSLLILYDVVMLIGLTPSRGPGNQKWLTRQHR